MHLSFVLKYMLKWPKKMSSHINDVLKQALTTFICRDEEFTENLEHLTSLLDKTTAKHVNLHESFSTEELWQQPDKAPVTCIEIYEDSNVTMGIFIMKPGGKLPLHNHPEMYGLIKVISGEVNIISYSINTQKTKEIDQRSFENLPANLSRFPNRNIITAELNETISANVNSPTCTLDPENRNFHEIESVNGPAAFLDILAPPYGTAMSDNRIRNCTYYTKLSQAAPNIFRLQEIKSPSWYWTDRFPYTGPPVAGSFV